MAALQSEAFALSQLRLRPQYHSDLSNDGDDSDDDDDNDDVMADD